MKRLMFVSLLSLTTLAGCAGSAPSNPTDAEALAAVQTARELLTHAGHVTESAHVAHVQSCLPGIGTHAAQLMCTLDVDGSEVRAVMWPTSNPAHPWRCLLAPNQGK